MLLINGRLCLTMERTHSLDTEDMKTTHNTTTRKDADCTDCATRKT